MESNTKIDVDDKIFKFYLVDHQDNKIELTIHTHKDSRPSDTITMKIPGEDILFNKAQHLFWHNNLKINYNE